MIKLRKTNLSSLVSFGNGKTLPKDIGEISAFGGNGVIGKVPKPNYPERTLIVGRVGSQCGNVHKSEEACWVTDNALAGIPKQESDFEFLYYLFQQLKLNELQVGSGQPLVTQTILHNLLIEIPIDINYREKIAKVLSTLDAKIELNNRINVELEALAKLLYDYWFVQFDFPMTAGQAAALGQPQLEGQPYKTSGGKMTYNTTLKREIPVGWKVGTLGDIESSIITGKTPPTSFPENFGGDIPFICIGDVRGNMHIVETELTLSKRGADLQRNKFIPKGAICVTCIASPGLIAFSTKDSQTNQQLNSIICKNQENKNYLYFYLMNYFKNAKGAKTGNTFANMNKGDFSSIIVLRPSKNLLEKFHKSTANITSSVLNNQKQNQELTALRDWLLPMLMNGQVTVDE